MSYGDPAWREWVLPEDQSMPFYTRSLELGINFFDTADMYSNGRSEEILGNALSAYAKRDEVVIASKVYFPMGPKPNQRGLSRKHIMEAIDASLKRLGTDYIDLYQIHRWDNETPIEETMSALNDLVRSGKVRYIGASSMYAWQFAKAQHVAEKNGWAKFVSMQNHWNLVYREEEREMVPLCRSEGVGIIPWSPLARGFLCGTRQSTDVKATAVADTKTSESAPLTVRARVDNLAHEMYYQPEDWKIVDAVAEIAKKRGCTQAQIALAWLLNKPGCTAPIIGATKMSHLEEACGAVSVKLSAEEMTALEQHYRPHKVLGWLTPADPK